MKFFFYRIIESQLAEAKIPAKASRKNRKTRNKETFKIKQLKMLVRSFSEEK